MQASGYGPLGPDADLGAFDFLAQARGGFASTNGEPDDPPVPAQVPIADQVGALHAAIAVLTGLVNRNLTGRGVKFDTSLLGQPGVAAVVRHQHATCSPASCGRARSAAARGRSGAMYRAGDDKWFVIGMLLDRAWTEVCDVIGRPRAGRTTSASTRSSSASARTRRN